MEDGVHQRPDRVHQRPEDDVKIDIKIHSDEEYRDDEDDRENQYHEVNSMFMRPRTEFNQFEIRR